MPVVVHSSPGLAFPKQTFTDDLDQLKYVLILLHFSNSGTRFDVFAVIVVQVLKLGYIER